MRRYAIGIAELKNNLSENLKQVEGGSEIIVLDRRRPIAKISPIDAATLVQIEPARRKLTAKDLKSSDVEPATFSSLDLLNEERDSR